MTNEIKTIRAFRVLDVAKAAAIYVWRRGRLVGEPFARFGRTIRASVDGERDADVCQHGVCTTNYRRQKLS